MFDFQEKLSASAAEILQKIYGRSTPVHFDVSFQKGHGDLTTSVALSFAKDIAKSPKDIATSLADGLSSLPGVATALVAGPGFVNVTLTDATLAIALAAAGEACVPVMTRAAEQPVIVEYSSPNIAKPLGVHHILTTSIGQVLANVYRHLGYSVVSISHIGDWGTQFGKLYVAHLRWGGGKDARTYSIDDLLRLYVRFHEEVEKTPSLEDEARQYFVALEQGSVDVKGFWKSVVDVTLQEMEPTYHRLHVHFDEVQGESFYETMMSPVVEEGIRKGVITKGEGSALVVEFPEETKIPTAIVVKSDGSTIYLTRDLATIRYRIDTWNPKAVLYVVGAEQQNHFRQLFAIVGMLEWTLPHLEHISFGRMRFADRSMSTRKGNVLKLEEVLDEAVSRAEKLIAERGEKIQSDDPKDLAEMMGVGALVYGILSQNRKMDMVFDWDKMLSFEGNSAPYLQYTHARAKSVLRKAGEETPTMPASVGELSVHERTLVKLLVRFGDVLEEARAEHLPHKLATYLYELCQAFNAFYNADDILTAPDNARALRLVLTATVARVLKTGAELLTLRVPDRM